MTRTYYLYSIDFPNGKRYIGITDNLVRRLAGYKTNSKSGSTKQKVFNAIRKYGITELKVLVIGTKEYILELERKAIALFRARENEFGYNQALGGEMSPVAGIGHTAVSKAKMSISQKRRVRTPDAWLKFATSRLGLDLTEEHRLNLSKAASKRWAEKDERRLPRTLERIQKVRQMLTDGFKRREIATALGLSKSRTRLLILQTHTEPILTDN